MTVARRNALTCFVLTGTLMCLLGTSPDRSAARAAEALLPDYRLVLAAGQTSAEFAFAAAVAKEVWILVDGLEHGGFVKVRVNGLPPTLRELQAVGGLPQGRADRVLIKAPVRRGQNRLQISEMDGAQIVRVPHSDTWFGTSSDAAGSPRFSVDFGLYGWHVNSYPVTVYYGPMNADIMRFTGRFDMYHGESFTSAVTDITGKSGVDDAGLSYVLHYPRRGLLMPTSIRLVPGDLPGNFSLRVWQRLQAVETPVLDDLSNMEFLHSVTPDTGGLDWGDGVPDWVWYRALAEDNPDVVPDSATAACLVDDPSTEVFSYRASTSDPTQRMLSGPHHTGGMASMEAVNAIGGWFTRTGSGCVGLVFSRYRATFRDDLRPVFGHCGEGADTHFFIFADQLFGPLGMEQGDEIEIKYSLFFLPAEPLFDEICALNDMDLQVFGTEPTQGTPITAWVATRKILGLQREDGSLLLLGLGSGSLPMPFPIAPALAAKAQRISCFASLDQSEVEDLQVTAGAVPVLPGAFTLVDCGAAMNPPQPPFGW